MMRNCDAHTLAPGLGRPKTAGSGVSSVSIFCDHAHENQVHVHAIAWGQLTEFNSKDIRIDCLKYEKQSFSHTNTILLK
jgi:hypothetical protein